MLNPGHSLAELDLLEDLVSESLLDELEFDLSIQLILVLLCLGLLETLEANEYNVLVMSNGLSKQDETLDADVPQSVLRLLLHDVFELDLLRVQVLLSLDCCDAADLE